MSLEHQLELHSQKLSNRVGRLTNRAGAEAVLGFASLFGPSVLPVASLLALIDVVRIHRNVKGLNQRIEGISRDLA